MLQVSRLVIAAVVALQCSSSVTTTVSAFTATSTRPTSLSTRRTGAASIVGRQATNDADDDKAVEEVVERVSDEQVYSKHIRPKTFATKCASLYHPSAGAGRGLAPPVYFGSTFLLDDAAHGARLHEKVEDPYVDQDGYVYSRWGSPTCEGTALQIAALEGVDAPENHPAGKLGKCLVFNSGMSAITSSLMAVIKHGDHMIFPYTVYGGTNEFVEQFAVQWGVTVTYVDGAGANGPENYKAAFQDNTKVVYTETPANPTMRLTDLAGVAQVVDAHYGTVEATEATITTSIHERRRPWIMVDGTFATPYHQRVLDIPGIDVSIHSATKYLGGHSDLLAGSVTSRSTYFNHACAKVQKLITVPLNPMDSFLLARGLRTLDVRMERHGRNAMVLAKMLEQHPDVKSVFYPGLASHPDRAMAETSFLSGRENIKDSNEEEDEDDMFDIQTYGGMVTFIMAGDEDSTDPENDDTALQRARNVCEHLRVMNLAVSLGGVESLVEHPASMTHTMIPKAQRLAGGLDDGLIRLSVGLENIKDLKADLLRALNHCDENGCDLD